MHKKFEECTFKNKLIGFFPYCCLTRFCHSLISKYYVLPISDIDITRFYHSINESFGIFYFDTFHNNLTLALFSLFNCQRDLSCSVAVKHGKEEKKFVSIQKYDIEIINTKL